MNRKGPAIKTVGWATRGEGDGCLRSGERRVAGRRSRLCFLCFSHSLGVEPSKGRWNGVKREERVYRRLKQGGENVLRATGYCCIVRELAERMNGPPRSVTGLLSRSYPPHHPEQCRPVAIVVMAKAIRGWRMETPAGLFARLEPLNKSE